MNAFELVLPKSLEDAVSLLDPDDPTVRVMSGGTALMLMMKSDVFQPSKLISLRDIGGESAQIVLRPDGSLRIGGMTTLASLENSPQMLQFAPVVKQAMRLLATPRVRNVATVGGALAHGDPHMDLPPLLVALDATVIALGPDGERRIPAGELHVGYYETVLAGDELIKEVIVPPQGARRAAYLKCTTRAAKDWPALGVAVSADMRGDTVADIRLVVGAVAERPLRVSEAEALLNGASLTPETIRAAGDAAAAAIETIPDELGSAAYKTQLVRVYVERALRAVVAKEIEVTA